MLSVSEPPGYCADRAKGREGWDVGSSGLARMCWSGFGLDVLCVSLCVLACRAPCQFSSPETLSHLLKVAEELWVIGIYW